MLNMTREACLLSWLRWLRLSLALVIIRNVFGVWGGEISNLAFLLLITMVS